MFGIIVGTHGKFSEEIIKSCEMICGPQANVRAVTLVPGEGPDDMAKKYEAAIAELDCADGVLFLNDLSAAARTMPPAVWLHPTRRMVSSRGSACLC